MPNAQYSVSVSCGGVTISASIVETADHPQSYEVPLPAAKAGTLSTRTDNTSGVLTVASGHGITTSNKVDIYWNGGMRYGCTVSATASTTITFASGSGDNLPTQGDAITVAPQVTVNTQIDGDAIKILAIDLSTAELSGGKGHVDMQDSGNSTIEEIDLVGNTPQVYHIAGGATNVFSGNPIVVTLASNGSATLAATLKIVSLEDSTP